MIFAQWPTPPHIHACTLTKTDSLTDLPDHISLKLLQQVHANHVVTLPSLEENLKADGTYTQEINTACAIKTADCLAILLCDAKGTEVAALHGGWKGLAQGIIFAGLEKFKTQREQLLAWLGPAICAQHYEVDELVFNAFPGFEHCFTENRPGHWLCDLYAIACQQLQQAGVRQIFSNESCTYENTDILFSYRREPKNSGRLMHLIWREPL